MTKKLLITFHPADYYFFGGEETFDTDTVPNARNYLVRSNKLPQQTAVIGLLRHVLLTAGLPFGPESFNAGMQHSAVQAYGALLRVSPLFLQAGNDKDRRFLLPASKLQVENNQALQVDFKADAAEVFAGGTFQPAPTLLFPGSQTPYSAKVPLRPFWLALNDSAEAATDTDEIFISSLHIGIDKMSRIKSVSAGGDEEGFYKQEFFRLKKGYRFAVVAEFDQPVSPDIFKTTMPFGGESRTFSLEAEEWTSELANRWQPDIAYGSATDRIVLTSDAFVSDPDALFSLCRFVVAECKPFRNIQVRAADYSTQTFANLHRKKRQEVLWLLERGSVLFPQAGKVSQVVDILNAPKNFQTIGYNHFHPHQSLI